jgi:hypothetical protein
MGKKSFLYCNEGPHGGSPDGEMDIDISPASQLRKVARGDLDEKRFIVTGESWNNGGNLWRFIESGLSKRMLCRCLASSVVIPAFVHKIPENVFVKCSELITVEFAPNSEMKVIAGFLKCPKLRKAVIPGSVEELSGFLDCPKLKDVLFLSESKIRIISGFHSTYARNGRPKVFLGYCEIGAKRRSLQLSLSRMGK